MKKFYAATLSILLILGLSACKRDVIDPNGQGNTDNIPTVNNPPASSTPSKKPPKEVGAPEIEDVIRQPLENKPVTFIYDRDTTSEIANGDPVYSNDKYNNSPILTVTPTGAGLKIQKNHDSKWVHNTIHVISTRGVENIKMNNVDETKNEFLYPFVKAGEEYTVHIEKQEEGWTNWGESQKVTVRAIGGLGNLNVTYSDWYYNPSTYEITFKDFTITVPETLRSKVDEISFHGNLFLGKMWESDSLYTNYTKTDSKLAITDDASVAFIANQPNLSLLIETNFSYGGFEFVYTVFGKMVYSGESGPSKALKLTSNYVLPEVIIHPADGFFYETAYQFGDSNWHNAYISVIGTNGLDSLVRTPIQIKERGNSTRGNGKMPYSIKFSEKTPLLGMKKAKRWVFMANYFDRSLIRTDFAGYLGNHVFNSTWNASFTPVNLYIGDTFIGTYDLGECNKITKQRVNIQSLKDFAENAPDYTDVNRDGKIDIDDAGFILEIDTANEWAEHISLYTDKYFIPMTLKEPDFDDCNYVDNHYKCEEYKDYASSKINALETMLRKSDFESHYKEYIDETSFVDWYLINEFAKNTDAIFQKSVCITYNPADGRFYMGPNWDFDLGLGNSSDGCTRPNGNWVSCDNPEGWYIHNGKKWVTENQTVIDKKNPGSDGYNCEAYYLNRLLQSNSFKAAVQARWNERKIYLKNAINEQIVTYANMVNGSIPQNEKRLPRIGKESWNGPSSYATHKTYGEEVYYLYDWCMKRYNWMDKKISAGDFN